MSPVAGDYREFVEQVRAAHGIKDVVGRYIKLHENNTSACPFHKESRPSFSLNIPEQYFHCFGCKASGDVFKFVELMEGMTFTQAVELLAQQAGIPVYRAIASDRESEEIDRAVKYVTEAVSRYYHYVLTDEARTYFVERRRLPEGLLERFLIGWADGHACSYIQNQLGPEWLPVMVQAGLASEIQNQMTWVGSGLTYRDLFFERIMFPLTERQTPVFLSGRALDDREPKYLHQKGREAPLFNEEAVGPEVYITEGPFDALSLIAWELPAVALNGSLRPGLVARFQRVKRALLVLDSDRAGIQGTLELAAALWPRGEVVPLPRGMDPNDFYRHRTKEEFLALVDKAMDPVRFAIEQVPADIPREQLSDALAPAFKMLAQVVKPLSSRAGYLESIIAPRFGLKKEAVEQCWVEIESLSVGRTRCHACGTVLTSRTPRTKK